MQTQRKTEYCHLSDLIRRAGGWPIDLHKVAWVLDRADTVLKDRGGRDYHGWLSMDDVDELLQVNTK